MRQFTGWLCAIVTMVSIPGVTAATHAGTEIDLTSFGSADPSWGESADALLPLEEVAYGQGVAARRLYVSGIVGASFASLTTAGGPNSDPSWNPDVAFRGTVNDTLFTGGGAIGIAWARPAGALRAEFEGRGRDMQDGTEELVFTRSGATLPNTVRATDGWSTMVNLWRDWYVMDRLAVYGGGGIGGGGYQLSTFAAFDALGASVYGRDAVGGFAWQAGGGVFYHLSERVAIDLGYRFFAIDSQNSGLLYDGPYPAVPFATGVPYGTFTSAFSTSELLLSLRIYEPFRRWR